MIIITHYIDEARNAANVAFLRNGSILKQDNPLKLIDQYNSETLEQVFYYLSQQQKKHSKNYIDESFNLDIKDTSQIEHGRDQSRFTIDPKRVWAVLWKDTVVLRRNFILLFIYFFVPISALITLRYAFHRTPTGVGMGVFNDDNQEYSQRFIDFIDRDHIKLNHYSNKEAAVESVVNGTNYIAFGFRPNFTDMFEYRLRDANAITEEELHTTNIPVYVDFTSPMVILSGAYLLRAFRDFLLDLSDVLGANAYIYFHTVHVEESLNGDLYKFSMADTLDPAFILIETQIVPLIMSALHIINMRRFAHYERDLVAGVKQIEVLVAHFIQMTGLMVVQALTTMIISFGINGSRQEGSYWELFLLLMLFGWLSMGIGISIAICVGHSIVGAAVSNSSVHVLHKFPHWDYLHVSFDCLGFLSHSVYVRLSDTYLVPNVSIISQMRPIFLVL